jgi:hypothetical protein
MLPYSCSHVRLRVLTRPFLRTAFLHGGEVLFELPSIMTMNYDVRHSGHVPPVAAVCPTCGEPCGWRLVEPIWRPPVSEVGLEGGGEIPTP